MRTNSCFQWNNPTANGFCFKGIGNLTVAKLLYHAGQKSLRQYLFANTARGIDVAEIHWKKEEEELRIALNWAGLVGGEVIQKSFFLWIGPEGRFLFEGMRPWPEDVKSDETPEVPEIPFG